MRFSEQSPRVQASLVLRFVLEMAAVAGFSAAPALGLDTAAKWALVAAAPFVVWTFWGLLGTPNDPARGDKKNPGQVAVPIPGVARLLLELVLFLGAAAVMAWAGVWWFAWAVIAVTVVQVMLWPERIRWLVEH